MSQKTYTIDGKQHQIKDVEKELKKKHHIPSTKTPDGKIIVEPKDAAEENALIDAVHKHGAKIKR